MSDSTQQANDNPETTAAETWPMPIHEDSDRNTYVYGVRLTDFEDLDVEAQEEVRDNWINTQKVYRMPRETFEALPDSTKLDIIRAFELANASEVFGMSPVSFEALPPDQKTRVIEADRIKTQEEEKTKRATANVFKTRAIGWTITFVALITAAGLTIDKWLPLLHNNKQPTPASVTPAADSFPDVDASGPEAPGLF